MTIRYSSFKLSTLTALLAMEQLKRVTFGYSLKNIPIPAANTYRKALVKKVECVLKRMRWRAFFFLQGMDRDENDGNFDNFVFKSRKCPPQVKELKAFEEDMLQLVEVVT